MTRIQLFLCSLSIGTMAGKAMLVFGVEFCKVPKDTLPLAALFVAALVASIIGATVKTD